MAFYEMLPGAGMPSGLQAGMDSVLNKKFGTSTTYPAEGWPDTVNLLGPLHEKTVSGAIVTFADGADAVPLKKCEITLPASLDGYSSVSVKQAGKNLADVSANTEDGLYHASVSYPDNGVSVSATGTYSRCAWIIPTIVGVQYTLSYKGVRDNDYGRVMLNDTATAGGAMAYGTQVLTATETAYTKTFTATSNILYLVIYNTGTGTTGSTTVTDIQLEVGSSASDFAPYTAPDTHTADLGRTIHGGTANVTAGQGESGYGKVDLGTLTWTKRNTSSGHWRFTTQDVPVVINDDVSHIPSMDCIEYTAISPTQSWNGVKGVSCNTGMSQLMVCDETYETASDFTSAVSGVYLVYPLATPDPFTFDPISIDSKLGNNTLWSEQGSAEVTYRSQGTTTPILPTLVTKTITENGTYSAEDDDADGYSEVTVNVESIAKIGINSGKLNIVNGTITADDTYCYTDPFDCPSGVITMDVGEGIVSDYAGIELIYESDGSHANYWQGASRFREVDLTNYYAATKKARLAFKKQYLSKVLLMDFGNGKIYSSLNASQFEEPQANLLSMNNAQSEESEEE